MCGEGARPLLVIVVPWFLFTVAAGHGREAGTLERRIQAAGEWHTTQDNKSSRNGRRNKRPCVRYLPLKLTSRPRRSRLLEASTQIFKSNYPHESSSPSSSWSGLGTTSGALRCRAPAHIWRLVKQRGTDFYFPFNHPYIHTALDVRISDSLEAPMFFVGMNVQRVDFGFLDGNTAFEI